MHSSRILAFILAFASAGYAQISLGSAGSYGLLSANGIYNQGASVIKGNVGIYPENTILGFPPGVFAGSESTGNAVAATAQTDAKAAFNHAYSLDCKTDLSGQNLEGIFTPGVYCFFTGTEITGTVTLDGQGNPNAQFVFQVGGGLTTNTSSKVILINGARPCAVIYAINAHSVRRFGTVIIVPGTANLGQGSALIGNVLASDNVIIDSDVAITGGIYSLGGYISVNSDQISQPGSCSMAANPPLTSTAPSKTSPVMSSTQVMTTCKPHSRHCVKT